MASRRSGLGFEAFKSGTTLVLLLKSNSPTDYIKSVHVVHPILGHFFSDSWCQEVFLYNPLKLKVHKNNKSCRRITLKLFERRRINIILQISQETRGKFFKRLKPPSQRHCCLSMSSSLPPSAALVHFSESLLSLSWRNVPRKNLT